jgi:hypothetical protein
VGVSGVTLRSSKHAGVAESGAWLRRVFLALMNWYKRAGECNPIRAVSVRRLTVMRGKIVDGTPTRGIEGWWDGHARKEG